MRETELTKRGWKGEENSPSKNPGQAYGSKGGSGGAGLAAGQRAGGAQAQT